MTVGVGVDQARNDQAAAGVDDLGIGISYRSGRDNVGDDITFDDDVARLAARRRDRMHQSAFDHEHGKRSLWPGEFRAGNGGTRPMSTRAIRMSASRVGGALRLGKRMAQRSKFPLADSGHRMSISTSADTLIAESQR